MLGQSPPGDAVAGPEGLRVLHAECCTGPSPEGRGSLPFQPSAGATQCWALGPPWFSSPRASSGCPLGLELTPSPRKKVSQRTLRVKCGIFMPKAWTSWCEGPQCSVGVLCVAASRSLVSEPTGDAETQGPALADWEAGKEGLPPRNEPGSVLAEGLLGRGA